MFTNKIYDVLSDMSRDKVDKIASQYIQSCVDEIQFQVTAHGADINKAFFIRKSEIIKNAGQIRYKKKRVWIANFMEKHKFGIFQTMQLGNSKENQLTSVCINRAYQKDIKMYLERNFATMNTQQAKLAGREVDFYVPIDVEYLRDIDKSDWKDVECLTANAFCANVDKNNELPHYFDVSDSGRIYCKGLNLQTCSRRVRFNAIPKPCFNYDLRCGVFSVYRWMTTMLINQMNISDEQKESYHTQLKTPYLNDYIQNRTQIRIDVAKDINSYLNNVKEAFSAISFGAKTGGSLFFYDQDGVGQTSSLLKIFRNKDTTKAFLNHGTVMPIITDLKLLQDFIFEFFRNNLHLQCDDLGVVQDTGISFYPPYAFEDEIKPRNKSRFLAHIYQNVERNILDCVMAHVMGVDKDGWILPVHDGIYTNVRLDPRDINVSLFGAFGDAIIQMEETPQYHRGQPVPPRVDVVSQQHAEFKAKEEKQELDAYVNNYAIDEDVNLENQKVVTFKMDEDSMRKRNEGYTNGDVDLSDTYEVELKEDKKLTTDDVMRHFGKR